VFAKANSTPRAAAHPNLYQQGLTALCRDLLKIKAGLRMVIYCVYLVI
jgi:hypothetical protein